MHEFFVNIFMGVMFLGFGWLPPIIGVLWLRRVDANDNNDCMLPVGLLLGGVVTAIGLIYSALWSWDVFWVVLSVYACMWALGFTFCLHYSDEHPG